MEGVEDRAAEIHEPFALGVLIGNPRFASVYSLNFIRIDPARAPVSADVAAEAAHEMQGRHNLTHRRVLINDGAIGEELTPGFRKLGWLADRLVVMSLQNPIPVEEGPPFAEEYTEEEVAEGRRRYYGWRSGRFASQLTADVVRQLVAARAVTAKAIRVRNFAARLEDDLVSFADLYTDGKVAQIEDVGTIEPFRKRGLAKAVVQKAVAVAEADGHELVFLVADADDWPQEFYRRLGFEPIGDIYEFTLLPEKRA
jgi:ribosomal protein S18 acetylase RimI-like enzyme